MKYFTINLDIIYSTVPSGPDMQNMFRPMTRFFCGGIWSFFPFPEFLSDSENTRNINNVRVPQVNKLICNVEHGTRLIPRELAGRAFSARRLDRHTHMGTGTKYFTDIHFFAYAISESMVRRNNQWLITGIS